MRFLSRWKCTIGTHSGVYTASAVDKRSTYCSNCVCTTLSKLFDVLRRERINKKIVFTTDNTDNIGFCLRNQIKIETGVNKGWTPRRRSKRRKSTDARLHHRTGEKRVCHECRRNIRVSRAPWHGFAGRTTTRTPFAASRRELDTTGGTHHAASPRYLSWTCFSTRFRGQYGRLADGCKKSFPQYVRRTAETAVFLLTQPRQHLSAGWGRLEFTNWFDANRAGDYCHAFYLCCYVHSRVWC